MTLQEYAESRKLTTKSVKKLCTTVLQTIPTDLNEEQVQILDSGLFQASKGLFNSEESNDNNALVNILSDEKVDRVVEVVGVSVLKKNAELYRKSLEFTIATTLNQTANYLEKARNAHSSMLAQTYQNMAKDTAAVLGEVTTNLWDVNDSKGYLESMTTEDKQNMLIELGIMGIPESEFQPGGRYA